MHAAHCKLQVICHGNRKCHATAQAVSKYWLPAVRGVLHHLHLDTQDPPARRCLQGQRSGSMTYEASILETCKALKGADNKVLTSRSLFR